MSTALQGLAPHWRDLDWAPTGIGTAMLSWHGADHESWRSTGTDGAPVMAKAPRAHARGSSAVAARVAAARVGVGPEVLAVSDDGQVSVEVDLGAAWSVATGLRLQLRPGAIAAIGEARRRFRESDALLPSRDLGLEVQTMLDALAEAGAVPPQPVAAVAASLERLRAAVADGPPPVPCWLSSETSDIQLGPEGAVLFTGGTAAGTADPLADVGALLTELSPTVLPPEDAFRVLWGSMHPGAYARARIWGVIADLRVILIAMAAHAQDPDSPVGYLAYLGFRLWHVEHPVMTGELDELIVAAQTGWE